MPTLKEAFPGYLPVEKEHLDHSPKIAEQLNDDVKQSLQYLKRGDLGVPEHALKAAAYQYAESCDSVNKEYMLCKKEEGDPRKCLKYGDKVSVCAEEFFKKVSEACTDSFVKLAQCIEENSKRRLTMCRSEQFEFDNCVLNKLGFDKLPHGGLIAGTKIKTDRPKPVNPMKFEGPILDTRRQPAPDFFQRPTGQTRDGDENL